MFLSKKSAGLFVFLLIGSLGVWGCASLQKAIVPQNQSVTFETSIQLLDKSGKESTSFTAGDPVTMVVTVTNVSTSSQEVYYSSAHQFDFWVMNPSGQTVWQWSADKAFTQMVSAPFQIIPGQSLSFTTVWNQKGNDGSESGPGQYLAKGRVAFAPSAELSIASFDSSLLSFTIIR